MGKTRNRTQNGVTPCGRSPRVRVFIVDDHALLRKGLRGIIEATKDLVVCGEAGSSREALRTLKAAAADVAIVDISLPGEGGLELVERIRKRFPAMTVVVLTMYEDKLYAARAFRAGAKAYVMKQDDPDCLLEAIRAALRGELYLSEPLKSQLLSTLLTSELDGVPRAGIDALSARELQVFEAIGRGLSTLDIAQRLGLSHKTVEAHRSKIKRKLALGNGATLVCSAVRWVEFQN